MYIMIYRYTHKILLKFCFVKVLLLLFKNLLLLYLRIQSNCQMPAVAYTDNVVFISHSTIHTTNIFIDCLQFNHVYSKYLPCRANYCTFPWYSI